MSNRLLALGIAAGLLLLLVLCVVLVGLATPVLGNLRSDCAVGVAGTSASITVRGALAGRTCRELLRDAAGGFYELSSAPTQPVVCEHTRGRQRFIVRDEGILKLVGNATCDSLRKAGR